MDGGKVKKIKLADINPVFHKSKEANYTILLGLWECIKVNMWVSKRLLSVIVCRPSDYLRVKSGLSQGSRTTKKVSLTVE